MAKYFTIRQEEDENFTQYLIWARDLLERGHSTNKLELIDVEGLHIPLLKGLWDRWVRDRVSKQVDKWSTMDEVFTSITLYTDQSNKTRIYSKLEYKRESLIWVSKVTQGQGFPYYQQKGQSYTWKDGYQRQNSSKQPCFLTGQQQVDKQQQGKTTPYDHKNSKEIGYLRFYHCEGPHYISQCEKYQKERNRYQNKHEDIKRRMVSKLCKFTDNRHIGIREAFFDQEDNTDSPTPTAPQLTEEEIDKLCQALEQPDSEWLWREVKEIHINEAKTKDSKPILYRARVNSRPVITLFNTGAGMSVMSSRFFRSIVNKPKVFTCHREIRSVGGDPLVLIGECFVDSKIGKWILRDRVNQKNLSRDYIIGVAIQHANKMLTGFSTSGKHFISLNGKMIAQSVSLITTQCIIKCKSRTLLHAYAMSIISVRPHPTYIHESCMNMERDYSFKKVW